MEKDVDSIINKHGEIELTFNEKNAKTLYDEFKDMSYIDALAHLNCLVNMKNALFNNPGSLKLYRKMKNRSLNELNTKFLDKLKGDMVSEVISLLSNFEYSNKFGLYDMDNLIGVNENNTLSMLIYYSKSLNEINKELDKRLNA